VECSREALVDCWTCRPQTHDSLSAQEDCDSDFKNLLIYNLASCSGVSKISAKPSITTLSASRSPNPTTATLPRYLPHQSSPAFQ
jgi:hypothetical protein